MGIDRLTMMLTDSNNIKVTFLRPNRHFYESLICGLFLRCRKFCSFPLSSPTKKARMLRRRMQLQQLNHEALWFLLLVFNSRWLKRKTNKKLTRTNHRVVVFFREATIARVPVNGALSHRVHFAFLRRHASRHSHEVLPLESKIGDEKQNNTNSLSGVVDRARFPPWLT